MAIADKMPLDRHGQFLDLEKKMEPDASPSN